MALVPDGCVYATATPGVVFKITGDEAEAKFIKAAIDLQMWPEGIVQYYNVVELSDTFKAKKGVEFQLYAIWREEAFEIGKHLKISRDAEKRKSASTPETEEFLDWLEKFQQNGQFIRKAIEFFDDRGFLKQVNKRIPWAEANVAGAEDFKDALAACEETPEMVATRIALAKKYATVMERLDIGATIGQALLFYIEHGMLLADVHGNNVGTVHRAGVFQRDVLAITDPGQMVALDAEHKKIKVPTLRAALMRQKAGR